MLKSAIWFFAGYLTARYFILHYGVEGYMTREKELIGQGKEKVNEILEPDNY